MIDWTIKNEDMIIDEWGYSRTEWQQRNREILNKAISAYNNYITGQENDLSEVVRLIKYTEIKLRNECGSCAYNVDIKKMKDNLDYIVENKEKEKQYD